MQVLPGASGQRVSFVPDVVQSLGAPPIAPSVPRDPGPALMIAAATINAPIPTFHCMVEPPHSVGRWHTAAGHSAPDESDSNYSPLDSSEVGHVLDPQRLAFSRVVLILLTPPRLVK